MVECVEELVQTEYLIIGSGIAALSAAIELSKAGKKAVIVTKSKLKDSNTYHAQGGTNDMEPLRVERGEDKPEWLTDNTVVAGDGHCNRPVVEHFVRDLHTSTLFLEENGTTFSRQSNGDYVRHQEGGHNVPRTLCREDQTGRAIELGLCHKVRNDPNITIYENHTAVDLITKNKLPKDKSTANESSKDESTEDRCLGAQVLDRETGNVKTFIANTTFLASGGAGRAFRYTSSPANATGDGVAMAYRAGARIANMEFFQFHPTLFYDPDLTLSERMDLLTEAIRGEEMGGILTETKNSLVDMIKRFNPAGSHWTRDKVSQSIDTVLKETGKPHVWLNVTPKVTGKTAEYLKENETEFYDNCIKEGIEDIASEFIKATFPKIYARCLKKNIDITKEAIPVIPAAHYTCGGVVVDEDGRTDIKGLYAAGEVTYTGIMGANRLASNSLPEGVIWGRRAVAHAIENYDSNQTYEGTIPFWDTKDIKRDPDQPTLNQLWDIARTSMNSLCGIDRNEERLSAVINIIEGISSAINEIYWDTYLTNEVVELRNLVANQLMIAKGALNRKESRGGHYRSDYKDKNDAEYSGITIIKKLPNGEMDISLQKAA